MLNFGTSKPGIRGGGESLFRTCFFCFFKIFWRTLVLFLRFTSGATSADLLAASMVAEPSLPHTCKALVGLKTRSYHAAAHSVRSGRPDALPTEHSRLGCIQKDFDDNKCVVCIPHEK